MTQTTENHTENLADKALTRSRISDSQMSEWINADGATLDSLAKAFAAEGVDGFDDAGDGIFNVPLIKDKDFLRGIPFYITRWKFNTSDKYKDEQGNDGVFVSVEIAYHTAPGTPLLTGVFNDGSSGVCRQLQDITTNRVRSGKNDPYAGRAVRGGLRASTYQRDTGNVHPKTGEPITEEATTYYLDF